MQPVTNSSAPVALRSARSRVTSTDPRRAPSLKEQVLTTTRSASSGAPAGTSPPASIVPVSLSVSTWFFGQPRVSTQKERDIAGRVLVTGRTKGIRARSRDRVSGQDPAGLDRALARHHEADRTAGQ